MKINYVTEQARNCQIREKKRTVELVTNTCVYTEFFSEWQSPGVGARELDDARWSSASTDEGLCPGGNLAAVTEELRGCPQRREEGTSTHKVRVANLSYNANLFELYKNNGKWQLYC